MLVRDDEDLALEQLTVQLAAGRVDDRQLQRALAAVSPELGAELAERQRDDPVSIDRLLALRQERGHLVAQRASLPLVELRQLDALGTERDPSPTSAATSASACRRSPRRHGRRWAASATRAPPSALRTVACKRAELRPEARHRGGPSRREFPMPRTPPDTSPEQAACARRVYVEKRPVRAAQRCGDLVNRRGHARTARGPGGPDVARDPPDSPPVRPAPAVRIERTRSRGERHLAATLHVAEHDAREWVARNALPHGQTVPRETWARLMAD